MENGRKLGLKINIEGGDLWKTGAKLKQGEYIDADVALGRRNLFNGP